jgi:hypothetical protein
MQDYVIDIADWPEDEEFAAAYPEGARPKRTLFSPRAPSETFIKPDWRYMFKRSAERYPEQFWAEIIAYEISVMLNIPAPPCYAAIDSRNGQCGALSAWFYKEGDELFFAAGNYFHKVIPEFDREKGSQHNLVDAEIHNTKVLGGIHRFDFWSMMLFDSIIGNTDRHQDNWGHLVFRKRLTKSVAKRQGMNYGFKWRFAPWFDNGTSLGHELLEEKFTRWDAATLDRYIMRGKHHFRFSRERLERISHVDSMKAVQEAPLRNLLVRKLREFNVDELAAKLDHFVAMEMPDGGSLSMARSDFIIRLTQRRVQIAMDTLNEHN